MKYKIVRFYHPEAKKSARTIKTGLSLQEAQAHCNDPKTSKKTGPMSTWYFDGYAVL